MKGCNVNGCQTLVVLAFVMKIRIKYLLLMIIIKRSKVQRSVLSRPIQAMIGIEADIIS